MNKGKLMNIPQQSLPSSIKQYALQSCPLKSSCLKHSAIMYLFVFFALFLSSTIFSSVVLAQGQQSLAQASLEIELKISDAELAQTLAPIALYPDTLLTHILIAATYPIEVIAAERWLAKHSKLTVEQLQKRAEGKGWDASVNALLPFPRVMSQLSEELNWMKTLGDAFLQDEARVLASIQTLRKQAEQAGSLANLDNVEVIKEQQVIIIEPAQPTVIYVPYYDTRVVYGRWHWSHYPPIYWHNPHHYASHNGHFYWGHGVHISTHFFFSAFHWHNHHVVVSHYNRHGYHPRKKIVVSHNAKRWHHQPKHRRGVAYSSGSVKKKYHNSRPTVHSGHNVKKNKSIKHSTNTRSSNAKHVKVKSKSVRITKVKNTSVKSTNARRSDTRSAQTQSSHTRSNNQVKEYKSVQSKQRQTNKTQKPQRRPVHKNIGPKSSKQGGKVTKQHKNKYH